MRVGLAHGTQGGDCDERRGFMAPLKARVSFANLCTATRAHERGDYQAALCGECASLAWAANFRMRRDSGCTAQELRNGSRRGKFRIGNAAKFAGWRVHTVSRCRGILP